MLYMKKFKRIDVLLQFILIPLAVIYALLNMQNIFPSYFVVGGWQVISALIHLAVRYPRAKARSAYNIFLLTASMVLLTGLTFFPVLLYFLFFLLIASPVVAV